ncbi:glycosyltransferase 87 family protein [uncultured Jatrophihabitans sp.]|uniref:glycosyltransferase 87 family protein n=1 Tax=uncultured Jatrophihabitans sp. TaxID=1610747 RepID=UPI0035CC1E21
MSLTLAAGSAGSADRAGSRTRVPTTAVVVALTVLAAALRLYRLGFGYAHPVAEYDGSVYLSSALALVDGRLPYRDFVLVQPPGITLLLSPVALLGKAVGSAQAMGVAKILTGLAGAASVPLGAVVLRHRGPAAVTLGCAVLAVQGDAVAAAWTPLLEPWLVLCCLGAVALAFDGDALAGNRRLAGAGVLLGFACTIKIWAVAPALVLLVLVVLARRARAVVGGLLLGGVVPLLPFLLAAPHDFVRQVVVAQLSRTAPTRTTLAFRLVHVFATSPPDASEAGTAVWALLVAAALLVLALVAAPWFVRPPRTALERFATVTAVLVVVMLLAPDTFYWHYAAFSTPFVVLAALLRLPQGRGHRPAVALAGAAVLVLAVVVVQRYARPTHPYDNHVALQRAIPKGACVVSSTQGATIAADRLTIGRACPLLFDPFGEILAATGGHAPTEAQLHRPAVIRVWLNAYRHADFVYLQPRVTPQFPTDGPAQAYLRAHFRRLPLPGPGRLYERVRGR